METSKEYKVISVHSVENFLLTQHLAKKLNELFLPALSNLLLNTTIQFIAALKKDRPLGGMKHLYDFILEIRAEIIRKEGRKEPR